MQLVQVGSKNMFKFDFKLLPSSFSNHHDDFDLDHGRHVLIQTLTVLCHEISW